jgi:hypothetical protein
MPQRGDGMGENPDLFHARRVEWGDAGSGMVLLLHGSNVMGDVRGGADSLRYHRVADLAEKFKIGHHRNPPTPRDPFGQIHSQWHPPHCQGCPPAQSRW